MYTLESSAASLLLDLRAITNYYKIRIEFQNTYVLPVSILQWNNSSVFKRLKKLSIGAVV